MEELILSNAKDLFFSVGIKSVSMDDIARNAAISKKTIYKSFEDKNQLIERLVAGFLLCYNLGLEQCRGEANNAVEEIILSTQLPLVQLVKSARLSFMTLKNFFLVP